MSAILRRGAGYACVEKQSSAGQLSNVVGTYQRGILLCRSGLCARRHAMVVMHTYSMGM